MSSPQRGGSELRKLIEFAKELGFTCEVTASTHLAFRRPHTRVVWASYTPSCGHARKRTRRDLIKAVRESDEQTNTSKE